MAFHLWSFRERKKILVPCEFSQAAYKALRDRSQKVSDFCVMTDCWKGVSPLKIGSGFQITYVLFMIWLEEAAPLEITPGMYLLTSQHENPSEGLSCSPALWQPKHGILG